MGGVVGPPADVVHQLMCHTIDSSDEEAAAVNLHFSGSQESAVTRRELSMCL